MLYDSEKIASLMREKKLSGNALAKLAGISGPSMHDILSGKTKIVRFDTAAGIAAALGVPPQHILKIKPGKGGGRDVAMEASAVFAQLNESNQAAMLAAMIHLASQQKKK